MKMTNNIHTINHQSAVLRCSLFKATLLAVLMFVGTFGAKALEPGDSIVDEDFVKAYVIVADPGDVLYSTVGHVGIHMECPDHHLDYVFSYESEDVRHKVLSFLAGRLKMGMFAIPLKDYLNLYREEGRGVRQYVLNLPIDVKRNLWRILDNHLMEGPNLPYDYIKRGCAHSALTMLKEGLDTVAIHYGAWPETFNQLTRRELVQNATMEYPWTRSFLHLVGNGILDYNCSNEEKVILPADFIYVLQHASVRGQQLLSDEAVVLLPSKHHPKAHWCSPMVVAVILLILSLVCFFMKSGIMDYVLLTIQSVMGIVTVYLIFFSSLVCTEWSWLIVPFNPLPLLLWKWRRKWCLPYAVVIGIWALVMWLWPHVLTDSAYIVLSLALIISYINIFFTNKKK